jgi:S-adenosylmethionine:tRNA ribosyltransferase-isomerase
MEGHEMHAEWMEVNTESVQSLINHIDQPILAVGTTSLRTIESLYWMGVKTVLNPTCNDLAIQQWDVYDSSLAGQNISTATALQSLLNWMHTHVLTQLIVQTQICIAPGYTFKVANGIVTNFHQPQSTLLLLVAAAIGEDWKRVYTYALENDYRFLSYGDGSLLYFNKMQSPKAEW